MRSVHHGLAGRDERGRAAGAGRRAGRATTTSTGSSSSCRVPDHIDPDRVVAAIDPAKDVDGLTPVNAGLLAHGMPGLVPCTPAGVMELLAHEGVELEGAEAVVVGRSKLVGVPGRAPAAGGERDGHRLPLAHRATWPAVCRRADVLVAAVGVPRLLGADAVKPGAVVIDVGINRTEDGLVGDVDFEAAAEVAARDHAGARRGRADDDRDAARQHPGRRPGAGVVSRRPLARPEDAEMDAPDKLSPGRRSPAARRSCSSSSCSSTGSGSKSPASAASRAASGEGGNAWDASTSSRSSC